MTIPQPNEEDAVPTRMETFAVLRRVLAENYRRHLPGYLLAVACLAIMAAATAYTAWIMSDVINEFLVDTNIRAILIVSASIFGAFVARGIAGYIQAVTLSRIGNNLVATYQRRIFSHLMKLGVSYFEANRSGRLAAQISENVAGLRDLINITITSVARDLVALVALVGVMFAKDPVLSFSALIIGPPLILVVNALMKRLRAMSRGSIEVNARLLGAIQEASQGIAIVKAFTMEDQLARRIGALIDNAELRANRIARVTERTTPTAEVLAGAAVAGIIGFAGYRTATQHVPPGDLFAFITALLLAYDPARRLARVQVGLERSLVNARMIYEILDMPPPQSDAEGSRPLAVGKGEIRFENLSFSYHPGAPVLKGVSFTARAGATTALVGASGAGKTTLVTLLQRFHDPDTGRILIDGQDIALVTKQSLRNAIAYVSQQPYLFEGSIRDNIRYGREAASDADIEDAARAAYAHDFILAQPMGYDTLVGESGATLSGGQRQRISIARAILRNAPILLLDEATSALDNDSEQKVQEALTAVMAGRTTLVVAHRLSTVVNAGRIVVLDQGMLAEEGSHAELIKRKNGAYARFYRLQTSRSETPDLLGAKPESEN